jgi:hypothetical protein
MTRKVRADAERDYAVDALTEIARLPEQGGCDNEVTAVDLWRLMQSRAKQALDKLDAERSE